MGTSRRRESESAVRWRLLGELMGRGEGGRLFRSLFLLVEVELGLRRVGFARLLEEASYPSGAIANPEMSDALIEDARRMARALRRSARLVPGAACLHRALALFLWLRRRGIAAELCMGVRPRARPEGRPPGEVAESTGSGYPLAGRRTPGPRPIEGHAWVEWRGMPLDEDRSVCETFALLEASAGPLFRDTPREATVDLSPEHPLQMVAEKSARR
jgi:transglutaminase superfamily protein